MKRYIIFAGVNGAGKTTFYQTNYRLRTIPRVNLDELLRKSGDWKNQQDVVNAGREAVRLVKLYFEEGMTFTQETTLCGKSILRNIRTAKKQGYFIELYYVGLASPELAVERVSLRMKAGGHGIPEEDIRRRYAESLRNLKELLPVCDRTELYDNTETFRQVAIFKNGECIDQDDHIPEWSRMFF